MPATRTTTLSMAVDRAFTFLQEGQRSSGEYQLMRARTRDLADGVELRSIYGTAWVARALMLQPHRAGRTLERVRRFLRDQREPSGLWRYFGLDAPIPADVDDTACALLVLEPHPGDRSTIEAILGNTDSEAPRRWLGKLRSPSGAINTWFLDNSGPPYQNDVDAVVNANVATLLRARSIPAPALYRYLEKVLRDRSFRNGTRYSPSPLVFLFVMAGLRDVLTGDAATRVETETLDRVPAAAVGPVIEAALAAAALTACRSKEERKRAMLIERILADQQSDGGWQAQAVFGGPMTKGREWPDGYAWYGSREVTTATCILGLSGS